MTSNDIDTLCFPVCAGCKAKGSCDKEWKKPEPKPLLGEHWRGTPKAIRNAEIDRSLAPYIRLPCGSPENEHWSTREEQWMYQVWRPGKHHLWCGKCSKWVEKERIMKKKNTEINPNQDEIPF